MHKVSNYLKFAVKTNFEICTPKIKWVHWVHNCTSA